MSNPNSKTCPACGNQFHRADCTNYARKKYCNQYCASANMSTRMSELIDSNFDQLRVGDSVYFCIDPAKIERTVTGYKGRSVYTMPGNNLNPSNFFTKSI